MNGSIASVLKARRMGAGLSVREVQQRLLHSGITVSEKTVYGWESGLRLPDVHVFLALCALLGISSLEEFAGEPVPVCFSAADGKFLRQYEALDVHGKSAIQAVLAVERTRMEEDRRPQEKKPVFLSLQHFTAPVSAGSGTVLDTADGCEPIWVIANAYTRRADYVLTVRGKSMEPRFHNDDLILVEECDDVDFGEIGVWYLDGRSYVKQKGNDCLISLNPAYPNIKQEEYADMRCQGRVVGVLDPEWVKKEL